MLYLTEMYIDENNMPMEESIDSHIHKVLLASSLKKSRVENGILFKKYNNTILTYHTNVFDISRLEQNHFYVIRTVEVGGLYSQIKTGDNVTLYIRTAPMKKDQNDNMKALRKRRHRLVWLDTQLRKYGCTINRDENTMGILESSSTSINIQHTQTQQNKGNCIKIVYDYTVNVSINDADKFRELIYNGLGKFKSYGSGMILVGA